MPDYLSDDEVKSLGLPESPKAGYLSPDQAANLGLPASVHGTEMGSTPSLGEQTPKLGLIGSLNESLVKRGVNIADELTENRGISRSPEKSLRVTGQVAGLISDWTGDVLNTVIPDSVKDKVKTGLQKVAETDMGKAGLYAIRKGTEAYQSFKSQYPDTAKDIEAIFNIGSAIPLSKAGSMARSSASEIGNIASDVAKYALGKSTGTLDREIDFAVRKGIEKAIRPTVVGKGAASQIDKYYDRAVTAVNAIVENKNNLILSTAEGETASGLPKSLHQFNEAIEQTKKKVFDGYNSLQKQAGEEGAKIKTTGIAMELDKFINDPVTQDLSPEVIKYAKSRQKALWQRRGYTTEQAQTAIKKLNEELTAFYNGKGSKSISELSVDAMIANNLRQGLDEVIESSVGSGYQELKNTYGALKSIEKEVAHRSIVDARKNTKGLIDFSDIMTSGELIGGLATGNVGMVAKGVAGRGVKELYKKYFLDPNQTVKSMFENVDRLLEKRAASKSPFSPKSKTGTAFMKGLSDE